MENEPVTTIKQQAKSILFDLHAAREPGFTIEHSQPSAYFVDVDDREVMQGRVSILEGIARGEAVVVENRVYIQTVAKEKLSGWLK